MAYHVQYCSHGIAARDVAHFKEVSMSTNMEAGRLHSAEAGEPRGGRIGVAFDWGFGVQMAAMGLLTLAGVPNNGVALPRLAGLLPLAGAAVAYAQGEALRRGNGTAWWIQVLGNGALTLGGIGALTVLPRMLEQGRYGFLYTTVLLLVVSPMEVWLLTRPGSRRWYGSVTPDIARARHSGQWMTGTVAWAVVCGLLQTAAAMGWI